MSHSSALTSQTKHVQCVIENVFDEKKLIEIKDSLSRLGYKYAMILHNRDFNENGELKRPHWHLVFIAMKRKRLSSFLYVLMDVFGIDDASCIQIQVADDEVACFQYLVHLNNQDKTQYDVKELITNLTDVELKEIMAREVGSTLTIDKLMSVVKSSMTRTDVMLKIGLSSYTLYHRAIDELIKDGFLGQDLPFVPKEKSPYHY